MIVHLDQILPASAITGVLGWVAKAWQKRKQLAFDAEKLAQIMHHVAVLLNTAPTEDPVAVAVKMIEAKSAGIDLDVAKALIQATPAALAAPAAPAHPAPAAPAHPAPAPAVSLSAAAEAALARIVQAAPRTAAPQASAPQTIAPQASTAETITPVTTYIAEAPSGDSSQATQL